MPAPDLVLAGGDVEALLVADTQSEVGVLAQLRAKHWTEQSAQAASSAVVDADLAVLHLERARKCGGAGRRRGPAIAYGPMQVCGPSCGDRDRGGWHSLKGPSRMRGTWLGASRAGRSRRGRVRACVLPRLSGRFLSARVSRPDRLTAAVRAPVETGQPPARPGQPAGSAQRPS